MEDKLLNCPFCGSGAIIQERKMSEAVSAIVECTSCDAHQYTIGGINSMQACIESATKKWNTRTLSGQGKESLQEDKLLGEIKMILYKVMHLGKETLSAESNERIIHKDATIIIDMVHHWTKHTAKPAPVSVEEIIKVVMETYDDLFTDADFEPNLRNSLQTLFNPK